MFTQSDIINHRLNQMLCFCSKVVASIERKNRRAMAETTPKHSIKNILQRKKRNSPGDSGTYRLKDVLAEEQYYYTVNYFNMSFRPELRKIPADNPKFKDQPEDEDSLKYHANNIPSQTTISMKFKANMLEMDHSNLELLRIY